MERLITAQELREMTNIQKDTNKEELDVNRCLETVGKLLDSAKSAQRNSLASFYSIPWFLTGREKNHVFAILDGLGYHVCVSGPYDMTIAHGRFGWRFNIGWK